ncbi:MAG: HEAT repeat domain-containing protein [Ardenticatenaceae bacterium]|nr:HEAT repeat domain-containing protein [Ardenticatenaceae bacterium]
MNLLLTATPENQNLRTRLLLLLGQSFTLGILSALLVITANALFLTDYGSSTLPYVYLLVALLGSLVAYGSARAQSIWTLPQVAGGTMTAVLLTFLIAWTARTTSQARWVSFALIAAFPLLLQIGFVILGGQAGRLLDVRQIKQLFPQIVTGFVIGFIIGGLLMPFFINLLGSIENVILVMALAALIVLSLILLVGRRFPTVFQLTSPTQRQSNKTLPQLLSKKFVRWLFLYQMLLAALTQLTDFLVLAQTDIRYDNGADIAQFFSTFSVVMNITDLIFLLVIAAYFLNRFGLKAGLLANPVFLTFNFIAMLLIGLISGISSTPFFILVAIARVMTITLADGTTRTAINAVYQALPAQERSLVQTGAEGIGAPVAVGLVGLLLLLFNAIPGLTIMHVAALTFLLVLLWCAIGLLVHREYGSTLLQTIKRRALGDVALTLTDEASQKAVEGLLQSDQLHEVRLALDMLETAVHPSLPQYLLTLASHTQPDIQIEALQRIEQHKVTAALPLIGQLIAHGGNTAVQGAALQALCALDEAEAVHQVTPYLKNYAPARKKGALVGLLRYGGISGIMAATPHLDQMHHSDQATDRIMVAEIIGAVQQPNYYDPLLSLLQDEAQAVRQAALTAAAQVRHPRLLPLIIHNLNQPATRSAALEALLAYGPASLPHAAAALNGTTAMNVNNVKRLVRLCGQIGGIEAISLLRQHLHHPHREVQEQVFMALNQCGFRAETADHPTIHALLQQQAQEAATLLAVRQDIGTEAALQPLHRALQEEQKRVQRRLFLLLALLYDSRAILRAEEQLTKGPDGAKALALEMLDVTLAADEKALVLPLVDPQLTPAQRRQQLPAVPSQSRAAWLTEIMKGQTGLWADGWLQACAVYAVGKLGLDAQKGVVEKVALSEDKVVRETAVWALQGMQGE